MSQSGEYCDLLYYNKSHVRLAHDAPTLRPGDNVRQERVCGWTVNHPTGRKSLHKQVVVVEALETGINSPRGVFANKPSKR